jgi:hypothetical protein
MCCPAIGREDMGALLGITTETASRVIAEFKRGGFLREEARSVWRCDAAALTQIAAGGAPGNAATRASPVRD